MTFALVSQHHRPVYHFLPPANWMNDPNGVIHWRGDYHLFYQYNPAAPVWGNIHWGHAVSSDLVHWRHLPIALAPTPGSPDEAGCFSGCAVDDDGVPTLIYTGVRGDNYTMQTQCVAVSHDGLLTWEKYPANPVLADVPAETGQTEDFRDPFVWRDGETWYMVLATKMADIGGAALLYRSDRLTAWEYVGPLMVGEAARDGAVWECPNFFPLGEHWVLIVSTFVAGGAGRTVLYYVGSFDGRRFTPLHRGTLEHGALYAPLTMQDASGRRLLFGWATESLTREMTLQAGWSGVQTIPRALSLDAQLRLRMAPVPEVEVLRGEYHRMAACGLDGEIILPWNGSAALDIDAAFSVQSGGACVLTVACSADGRQRTDIAFDAANRTLTTRTLDGESIVSAFTAPHVLDSGEMLALRVLLDGSLLEVIANGRTSITHRLYPADDAQTKAAVSGRGARLEKLEFWHMTPIWPI
jgi:beta-fructofuranosidase